MISRDRHRGDFTYRHSTGKRVRDPRTLLRIRQLAIPPAWTDVQIAIAPAEPIQATGRDAKGRKQYRYNAEWTAERNRAKFRHLIDFATALPAIRRGVARDLAAPPLTRKRLLATLVSLLERTRIRVGNAEYARINGSYGLTTLLNEHVVVRGSKVEFRFPGKSGIDHAITLRDAKLAREVRQCQAVPDRALFDYAGDDGRIRRVDSSDVNRYLSELAGRKVTAKDFRTWWGTVSAAVRLRETPPATTKAAGRRNVCRVLDEVASELGNTRAVCRKSYVHPGILDAYLRGEALSPNPRRASQLRGLSTDEQQVVAWLRRHEAVATRSAA